MENEALRREGDFADAPDVTGRRGHLEEQLGEDAERAATKVDDDRDGG